MSDPTNHEVIVPQGARPIAVFQIVADLEMSPFGLRCDDDLLTVSLTVRERNEDTTYSVHVRTVQFWTTEFKDELLREVLGAELIRTDQWCRPQLKLL